VIRKAAVLMAGCALVVGGTAGVAFADESPSPVPAKTAQPSQAATGVKPVDANLLRKCVALAQQGVADPACAPLRGQIDELLRKLKEDGAAKGVGATPAFTG